MSKHFKQRELEQINSQHYFPIFWRGEGHTRNVFNALFKKNRLKKEVAFKITKKRKDIDESSVCALINLSKIRKPNAYKMEYFKEYFKHFDIHPNIASIIDALEIKDEEGNMRHVTILIRFLS